MMEKITYPAILNKNEYEEKTVYNVVFPDLSLANTYGESIKDARENAEILLKLLLDDEEVLPRSSTMVDIQDHYPDSIVSLITVTRERENKAQEISKFGQLQ
ncbi:type II toxin-antitoxin system HicB family antitoxin [Companilactobacillus zhongbaensis]|uniref:type II toxin-antitoxin system HicB family antitoxin n=1 Tax=Companilactobacillus zhongbaensis TaxID=2486009 RepID=UPI000F76CFF2|nr:type II toxin-antitoxin system HicB family antitoxin [Companilactobacillus zhongbaensis]